MAMPTVMANSLNSRPTMPPMNRMGMNTATSDRVMDTTVKPISLAADQRGAHAGLALFAVAHDVLQHHDGVIHHEAHRKGQRHER